MKTLSTTLSLLATFVLTGFGCSSKPQPTPPSANCNADTNCMLGATCSTESDCPASHCDHGTGKCVACLVDADCGSDQDCVASACLTRCASDAQCGSGLHCSQSKHCQACATDAQCGASEHCSNGACAKDACQKNGKTCDADSNGLRVCSPNGDSSRVFPCGASKTCVDGDDGANCDSWICTPNSKSCDDDGKSVRTCASDGLSFGKSTACKGSAMCHAGACVDTTCTPNSTFCSENNSRSCASDGQSSSVLRICGDTALCEESTGLCRSKSCTPGSKVCDGVNVATCKADGSGYDAVACKLSQVCSAGACQDLLCAPNERFCDSNGKLQTCNSTGTAIASTQTCSGMCAFVSGTSAICVSKTCTPGTPICDGTKATLCNADGTGPATGGIECASFDGFCKAGQCTPRLCSPNQRYCSGNSIYQCSSGGDSSVLYGSCSAGSVCDPATGGCVVPTCNPNSLGCTGSTVVKCDATGLPTATVQDCASTGQACSQGQCVTSVCSANGTYCKNGNVWQCNSAGSAEELYSVCATNTHCQGSSCVANACTPGKPVCSGNSVSTCAADGSGSLSGGAACSASQVCVNGACKAKVCTPSTLGCVSNDVYLCDSLGTAQTLSQHCLSEAYCANGACVPDVCPNSGPYCSGETFATCLGDGSGPVSASVNNCASSGKVCTTGGCVTSAVESIGSNTYVETLHTMGQILRVNTPRKLTRVQFDNAGSTATAAINTIVYSSTDNINFYLLSSTVGDAGAGTGYYDSGAISVQLQANTYYLIGMTSTYYLSPARETTNVSANLSFATSLKAVSNLSTVSGSTYTPTQTPVNYHVILTTALP